MYEGAETVSGEDTCRKKPGGPERAVSQMQQWLPGSAFPHTDGERTPSLHPMG